MSNSRRWRTLPLAVAALVVGAIGAGVLASGPGGPEGRAVAHGLISPTPSSTATAAATASVEPSIKQTPSPSPSRTASPRESPTSPPTPAPTLAPTVPSGFILQIPILTYHVIAPWSVAQGYSLPALDTDPGLFDAQLALLKRNGWHTITVDGLSRYLAAKRLPPRSTFVITIDDGHRDGYTYAFPILRNYGFVATYYVVVGRIGGPDDLTWAQVIALHAAGMEIGNHTMHHLDLATLTVADVRYEIDEAQTLLHSHLGSIPTTFAYPFGTDDATVVRLVAAAGFRMALTSESAVLEYWPLRLVTPRLRVYAGLSPVSLLARVAPFW